MTVIYETAQSEQSGLSCYFQGQLLAPGPKPKGKKRAEADARNTAYQSLPMEAQFHRLDQKLGSGVGAARQRHRLGCKILEKNNRADRFRPGVIVAAYDPDWDIVVAPEFEP